MPSISSLTWLLPWSIYKDKKACLAPSILIMNLFNCYIIIVLATIITTTYQDSMCSQFVFRGIGKLPQFGICEILISKNVFIHLVQLFLPCWIQMKNEEIIVFQNRGVSTKTGFSCNHFLLKVQSKSKKNAWQSYAYSPLFQVKPNIITKS